MKLKKLLIPSISLMIASPAINLVSCGCTSKYFDFSPALDEIEVGNYDSLEEDYAIMYHYSTDEITITKKDGKFSMDDEFYITYNDGKFSYKVLSGNDYKLVDAAITTNWHSRKDDKFAYDIGITIYSDNLSYPSSPVSLEWEYIYSIDVECYHGGKTIKERIRNCKIKGIFEYSEKGISNEIK